MANEIVIPGGVKVSQKNNAAPANPVAVSITPGGRNIVKTIWRVNGNQIGTSSTLNLNMVMLNGAGVYTTGIYNLELIVEFEDAPGAPYNKTIVFEVVE